MQGEAPAANGATTRLAEANQADLHTRTAFMCLLPVTSVTSVTSLFTASVDNREKAGGMS